MDGPEALLRFLHQRDDFASAVPPSSLTPIAERLELEGSFYAALRQRNRLGEIPTNDAARLRRSYVENAAHALDLIRSAQELRSSLGAKGVSLGSLKGLALLEGGINPGTRFCLDLDLLADAQDRDAVVRSLRELGYAQVGSAGPKHLPEFRRGNVPVEIHEVAFWNRTGRRWTLADLATEDPWVFTLVHLVHHLHVSSIEGPILAAKTIGDCVLILSLAGTAVLPAARRLAALVGLGTELDAHVELASALLHGYQLTPAGRRLIELCNEPSPREATLRELRYFARGFFSSPRWFRREFARSVLMPPEDATRNPSALTRILRPAQLLGRLLSRLSQTSFEGKKR